MFKSTLTALAVVLAASACSKPSGADNTSDNAALPAPNTTVTTNTSTVVGELETSSVVPTGWVKQWAADGDLNADGVLDQVLILKRDGNTADGPRRLLISFIKEDGTRSVVADTETFLPVVEDEVDPLANDNPLTVKNKSLQVYVEGTTTSNSHEIFTFRYQNSEFQLIGYDSYNQMRATGDYDNMSVNYSTGNLERTVGNIAASEDVKTKTRLPAGGRPTLSSINLTEGFSPPGDES